MQKRHQNKNHHNRIAGGLYLCQVNDHVSCGACCGLYNLKGITKKTLSEILMERTETFNRTPREVNAILTFGKKNQEKISGHVIYSEFHHCPYIGMIGEHRSRVGCLLHPVSAGNNGIDFRGLSYYGGMACRTYFCPSHELLAPEIKKVILDSADDWYTYGLMATETELLEFTFTEVLKRSGAPLSAINPDSRREAFLDAFREFLALKITWPYRPASHPGPCHYFFNDPKYVPPDVVYPEKSAISSRYHFLFRKLGSRFSSPKDVQEAELIIDRLFDKLAAGFRSP